MQYKRQSQISIYRLTLYLYTEILHITFKIAMFGKTHGSMNRIKIVLDEKGIKQTWLANQIGKSFNTVNGYVQNRQQPRMEILFQIARILDVDPKDLIDSQNFKTE